MDIAPFAVVTGAGRRLGLAIARHLALHRGYHVAAHFHTRNAAILKLAAEVATNRPHLAVVPVQADLTKDSEVEGFFDLCTARLMARVDQLPRRDSQTPVSSSAAGPAVLLINNASVFDPDTLDDASFETWERHHRTNVRSPFFLTQQMAQYTRLRVKANDDSKHRDENNDQGGRTHDTRRAPHGLVVNMADQRVRKMTPQFATYALAKRSLWDVTQLSARVLGRDGIRVNAIGPGPTLQGDRQSVEEFEEACHRTLLGYGGTPEDILHTLDYFMDARAVTGQLVCVDGGQHLRWETPDTAIPE